MTEFLSNILTFPTLFFTGLLALVLLYWLVSMMGFADFDFDQGDIALEDIDIDSTDVSNAAASSGFLTRFKLDGIPITITVSMVIFLSWILCFLIVSYYQNQIQEDWLKAVIGFWVIILAPILSALISGILLSPLKPMFNKLKREAEGRKADSLVGHTVVVRTNKVTMIFGDGEIDNEGANLILKIRAEEPNDLQRGDRVVITKYLPAEHIYMVRRTA